MRLLLFFILIVQYLHSDTINITADTNDLTILNKSSIFIDKNKSFNFDDIKTKEFTKNNKKLLTFSDFVDFNLWIKFKIKNNSSKKLIKTLALDYPLLYKVVLYDEKNELFKDGIFYQNKDRNTINPSFSITLDSNEEKTFYLKINSFTTAVIANLTLYEEKFYNKKDLHFQIIIFFFFGAVLILAVYNLSLFFFTKDKTYIFYVFCVLSMLLYQFYYLGFSEIYLFSHSLNIFLSDAIVMLGTLQLLTIILFVKHLLKTKEFPRIDKILNIYLILGVILSIVTYKNIIFDGKAIVPYLSLFIVLILVGILSLKKGNPLAKYYLLGWSGIVLSWVFMALHNLGSFNFYEYVPYYNQAAMLFEATIFSFALAKRINTLQNEKINLQEQLVEKEKNEKEKLEIEVQNKTKDLKLLLDEKEVLFKELYHRVKNNMQLIISLMRLQKNKFEDDEVKSYFQIAIERIQAMNSVHIHLYKDSKVNNQDTQKYFELLLRDLQYTYSKEIKIHYDIKSTLDNDDAIYCALIINELVSNSYKHAFMNNSGNIYISLNKIQEKYILEVKDDGVGYDKDSTSNLGLLIIETLVQNQLDGELKVDSKNGVSTLIKWEKGSNE